MIRTAARVFPQRLQNVLRRSPGVMAVSGGNQVEPPCRGLSQRLVQFEVGRFGVGHIARPGVTGGPGPWNSGGSHIISGPRAHESFPCLGPRPLESGKMSVHSSGPVNAAGPSTGGPPVGTDILPLS